MNKQLMVSALLTLVLAACSSTPMKDAAVEDKSINSNQTTTNNTSTENNADTSGANKDGVDGSSNMASDSNNPLKDPNNILSKRSIYFDYNKDEVKAEFRPLVEAHAKYLQANAGASLILQGNADDTGTREYNLSLGQRRAVAVKKVLNLLGVQDKQIETVSYGEEKANLSCKDDACKQQDRRVDIVYVGE
jgi:peptidoglycan-associated lipoprotein